MPVLIRPPTNTSSLPLQMSSCKGKCKSRNVKPINSSNVCYKCLDNPVEVQTREGCCRGCFIKLLIRDFRSNLRTKCIEGTGLHRNALLLCSGDIYSSSLLHLLLLRNKGRHLNFKEGNSTIDPGVRSITESDDIRLTAILHIDHPLNDNDGSIYRHPGATTEPAEAIGGKKYVTSDSLNEHLDSSTIRDNFYRRAEGYVRSIKSVFDSVLGGCNLPSDEFHTSSMHRYHLYNSVNVVYLKICYFLHGDYHGCSTSCLELSGLLRKLYNRNSIDTAKYLYNLLEKYNLIKYINSFYEYPGHLYVISPDTQDDIVKRLLYLTCIGNGQNASFLTSFRDSYTLKKHGTILRPMRTLTNKEIALYHEFNKISCLADLNSFNLVHSSSNIIGCINNFANIIKSAHSNSFYNVVNITNKLITLNMDTKSCKFCSNNVKALSDDICDICNYIFSKDEDILQILNNLIHTLPSDSSDN